MRQNGHAQHLRSGQWNSACVATQNGSQRVQLALFRARYGQLPAGGLDSAPAESRWLVDASADHRALDGEPSCCTSSTMCIPLWKGALLGVMLSCSRDFHSESNSQTASTVVSALRHSQDSDMPGAAGAAGTLRQQTAAGGGRGRPAGRQVKRGEPGIIRFFFLFFFLHHENTSTQAQTT